MRRLPAVLLSVLFGTIALTAGAAMTQPVAAAASAPSASWVAGTPAPGAFPLVAKGAVATVLIDPADAPVVAIAARDLAGDVERVAGVKPLVVHEVKTVSRGPVVLVGTLGHSAAIDALVASGKLDVSAVRGSWETFLIATVTQPLPGVAQGLVIVGSDRRGTAFGVYELSQAIGVSPWHWWADVVPAKKAELHVAAGTRKFGPPSVQYRGIFINDEDWGLQPWAAQTFSPEEGGIGPKVYRKVFELLLRLKANTLWPAMHECTKPFNSFPENARLADEYAIVMGSSHAEPMLRNNVGEWKAPKPDYNYVTNREGVRAYWEERVRTNGKFENIYTVGMRGIHDSGIQGTKTDAERIRVLEQVFADQRAMLAQHVRPEVEQVPQMFCAYKEVLDLYRQGLKVPEDVTIVWPDDNFGYVRNFASPEELKRSGGFGVYYHISYLGRPLSYLWLNTTPPALMWEEMTKAYAHGARKIWIVNVGDIKPAEIGTEFFLQLAWDVKRWGPDAQEKFLEAWAAREFGAEFAAEIASIMADYYRLNYQRKPEHLQWWLPKEEKRLSPFSTSPNLDEVGARLADWGALEQRYDKLTESREIWAQRDALFQMVGYPLLGSKAVNARYFLAQAYAERRRQVSAAGKFVAIGLPGGIQQSPESLTEAFDRRVTAGKWRGFFRPEPADNEWRSMRIARFDEAMPEPWAVDVTSDRPTRIVATAGDIVSEGTAELAVPPLSPLGRTVANVDVFNAEQPTGKMTWAIEPDAAPWLKFAESGIGYFRRISVSADWSKVPNGEQSEGRFTIVSGEQRIAVRVPIFVPRGISAADSAGMFIEENNLVSLEPEHFTASVARNGAEWGPIPGLGRTGDGSVAVFPATMPSISLERAAIDAPRLDYAVHFFSAGDFTLQANLIPAHPIRGETLRFAVALDDASPQLVELKFQDGSADWAQGVLNNTRVASIKLTVAKPGAHTLRVYGLEPGVVIDKLVLFRGELPPSYLGPPETRVSADPQ